MQSHSWVLAQRAGWDQQGQCVTRGSEGKKRLQPPGRNWVEMGPLKEMLQEPDLDQASEGETSARETGRGRYKHHCPQRMFQTIQSMWGMGSGKNWLLGEKGVRRRKVIRNLPDLVVLDPKRDTDEHYMS